MQTTSDIDFSGRKLPLPRHYSHAYDPFTSLAALAATTERIGIGTAVSLDE